MRSADNVFHINSTSVTQSKVLQYAYSFRISYVLVIDIIDKIKRRKDEPELTS